MGRVCHDDEMPGTDALAGGGKHAGIENLLQVVFVHRLVCVGADAAAAEHGF